MRMLTLNNLACFYRRFARLSPSVTPWCLVAQSHAHLHRAARACVCRKGKLVEALDVVLKALKPRSPSTSLEFISQTTLNACAVLSQLGR
jgi:hypothetical protein